MINSVTVTNFRNDSIDIELFRPEKTGFLITSIDGIGFADADINTMDVATLDGSQYVSSKMKSRSITLNFVFAGDTSVETLRHKCYKYFPSKKKVKLRFNTDNRSLWIEGYVEANKPDIFSENESVAVTVVCPDPYLRDDGGIVVLKGNIDPSFEFPFSNESLDNKLLEFGTVAYTTQQVITYLGEADTTGIVVTMEFTNRIPAYVSFITIYNRTTYEYGDGTGKMKINLTALKSLTNNQIDPFSNSIIGCKLIMSSVIGDKYIKILNSSLTQTYDVLGIMDRNNSSWLYLVPGENMFVVDATGQQDSIVTTIEYDTLYGGV